MPRSLRRLLSVALPLAVVACPSRGPAPPPAAPSGGGGSASHEPPRAPDLDPGVPHSSEEAAELEAARKARFERDARMVNPPDHPGAIPFDAETTTSGIAYQVLVEGTGPSPGRGDSVKVLMGVWMSDGTPIERMNHHETPYVVRMNRPNVPGLAEALAMVKEGGTTRFWMPQSVTWRDRKGAPEGTVLFQLTVVEVLFAPVTPVDLAAAPPSATVTPSGLALEVLTPGTGTVHPDPHDRVTVHYSGWTTDGNLFDSSITRGRPSTFPLDRVIEGWTEGLQRMVVGERTRLWIPEPLAYKGAPGKPAGMLVFDVELLEIDEQPKPPPPPEPPKSLRKPPRKAKRTRSGLAYRVLTKGSGKEHPAATSVVKVHYSGWTTDGKMFDSSVTRAKPTSFPLNRVIEGWTEAVQLMVVGEKTRFWIPEELAYKGQPGKPAGMLIFDIELLEIVKP